MPTTIAPVSIGGFGTIALSGTSVAISTLTTIAPSPAFPSELPGHVVTLWNSMDSTGNVYVNPLGGTATTDHLTLAPGQSQQFAIANSTTPTVISGSTSKLLVLW